MIWGIYSILGVGRIPTHINYWMNARLNRIEFICLVYYLPSCAMQLTSYQHAIRQARRPVHLMLHDVLCRSPASGCVSFIWCLSWMRISCNLSTCSSEARLSIVPSLKAPSASTPRFARKSASLFPSLLVCLHEIAWCWESQLFINSSL